MIDIIHAAGWPIYPIILCSVVALGIILERFYSLRISVVAPIGLKQVIEDSREGKMPSKEKILDISNSSTLGQIYAVILDRPNEPIDLIKEAVEDEGRNVEKALVQYLTTLGTIATLSPLLGLLGTIVGMIEIFGASSASGLADPAKLAHGISVALYNAAFGIIVAVPSLICYRHFRAKADELLVLLETSASKLLRVLPNH